MTKNIQHISILFISSLFAGVGNYLYYPLSLHFLSIEDFGVFMSLISIFNILGFITVGFSLYINKVVCEYKDSRQQVFSLFINLFLLFGIISLGMISMLVVSSPYIAKFIHIPSPLPIVYVSLGVITSFLLVVIEGVARGKQYFSFLGLNYIANAFGKLLLGSLFFLWGYSLYGAISGLVLGSSIAVIYGYIYLYRKLRTQKKKNSLQHLVHDLSKQIPSIISFSLVSIYIGVLMNIDILLARNIFSHYDAGVYASIAVTGKFILFLLLSIETVYYSKIAQQNNITLRHLIEPCFIIIGFFIPLIVFCILGNLYILSFLNLADTYTPLLIGVYVYYGLLTLLSFLIKSSLLIENKHTTKVVSVSLVALVLCVYTVGSHSLLYFISSFIFISIISIGYILLKIKTSLQPSLG